jgi:hypothetical protein
MKASTISATFDADQKIPNSFLFFYKEQNGKKYPAPQFL